MANKSLVSIFFKGLKIFCLNIHKFLLYMTFPILGQIAGLFLIFGGNFWFAQNIKDLSQKYPILNDMSFVIGFAVLLTLPGLLILLKAFWDYLVAYVALNSMTEGYLNTGKVYDFRAHNSVVSNKPFSFMALWFLFGIFTIVALFPVFWILGAIFFIYFILIFQVFTFENGLSPVGYFRRSFEIIKGKFAKTFALTLILTLFCYVILSAGVSVIFDYFNLSAIFSKWFETWAFTLPIEPLEPFGITPKIIADNLVNNLILFLTIGYTLPIRSICWTLWYNNLAEPVEQKNERKKSVKKTSSKTLKIEKRQIDPEIIRRARLEDDEY